MSKQYLTTSWSQLAAGIAMLSAVILVATIKLANMIGIGKALGLIAIGILVAAWVIGAAILIARALNKM